MNIINSLTDIIRLLFLVCFDLKTWFSKHLLFLPKAFESTKVYI